MGCIFSVEETKKVVYAGKTAFAEPVLNVFDTDNKHILCYVLSGEMNVKIGNRTICARKNHCFLCPSGVECKATKECTQGTSVMLIHFLPGKSDTTDSSPYMDLSEPFVYVSTLVDTSANDEIRKTFIRDIEAYNSGDKVRQSAHTNILLNDLSKNYLFEDSSYALALNIQLYINRSIPKNITNKEIASFHNVSVRTAETSFKKAFGISIHQFVINKKIELSKFWLRYFPEQKLSVLAQGLGFFDEYHFSRQFKKITGISPSEYRREPK